jgi:hypothetical protein
VTLGQGAFFFSSLFLPRRLAGRFVMGSLVLALGLGFYLIGGAVAPYPWVAVIFTFFVCLNLSFLSGWLVGGPLALTLVMIYTAGLNTGSPEKASANFLVFSIVFDLVSFRQSAGQMSRRAHRYQRQMREESRVTSDPTLRAVFVEDAVSISGNVIALVALALNQNRLVHTSGGGRGAHRAGADPYQSPAHPAQPRLPGWCLGRGRRGE